MHYRRFYRIKNGRGFSLIEVIISLIVVGILGTMVVAFLGKNMTSSAKPVNEAKNGALLNEIMEKMAADYNYQMIASPSGGLAIFKTNVETANKYGSGYTVVDSYTGFAMGPGTNNVNESTTTNQILKVTVTYQGLSATALFGG